MVEYQEQDTQSTQHMTVMMLSVPIGVGTSCGITHYFGDTRFLPPPSKPAISSQRENHLNRMDGRSFVATLTPESVQQKLLMPPRLVTILEQHKPWLSAFSSPQRVISTTTDRNEGEMSVISRCPHDNCYTTPASQHVRIIQQHHPSVMGSPKPSPAYNSIASTPALHDEEMSPLRMCCSNNSDDSTYSYKKPILYHIKEQSQWVGVSAPATFTPTVVSPVQPAAPVSGLPSSVAPLAVGLISTRSSHATAFSPLSPTQPYRQVQLVHLLQQQQEQSIKQEQEQLHRYLRNEVCHEQEQYDQVVREKFHDEVVLQKQIMKESHNEVVIQKEFDNEYNLDQLENSFYTFDRITSGTLYHSKCHQSMTKTLLNQSKYPHGYSSVGKTFEPQPSVKSKKQQVEYPLLKNLTQVLCQFPHEEIIKEELYEKPTTCMTGTFDSYLDNIGKRALLKLHDVEADPTDAKLHVDGHKAVNFRNVETDPKKSNQNTNERNLQSVKIHDRDASTLSPKSPSLPQYYSQHDAPNQYVKSIVERIMSDQENNSINKSHEFKETNDVAMSLSPVEFRLDSDTPRICNSASNMEFDTSSLTDDVKSLLEADATWHTDAINSMKSTISRALSTLRTLGTCIISSAGEIALDAVNASTESSSSTTSFETNPTAKPDFNLKELTKESRGSNNMSVQGSSKTSTSTRLKMHHQRNGFLTSVDTFSAAKPAKRAKCSYFNLKKPIPLNQSKMYPLLRSPSKNERDYIVKNEKTYPIPASLKPKKGKEEKKLARKQWGNKKLNRVTKQTVEKSFFVGKSSKSQSSLMNASQKMSSTKQNTVSENELSMFSLRGHIPVGVPTCKNDFIEILQKFIGTQCGNLDDTDDGNADKYYCSEDNNHFIFYSDDGDVVELEPCTTSKDETGWVTDKTLTDQNLFEENEQGLFKSKNIMVDINDKQFIGQFISSTLTKGILLMRHHQKNARDCQRPSKNVVHLKRGKQLSMSNFVGPKLTWNEINGDEKGELDLFEIHSIDKASTLELEKYPLAMPGCCFVLRMNSGIVYVFEAQVEDDALHFVYGMQWLIARLAFNLIIGNISVSCELLDVEQLNDTGVCYGASPSNYNEETQWTMAMNNATNHLVLKVASLH